MICHNCNHPGLLEIEKFSELPRVSSDCKMISKGGKLAYCSKCNLVQKSATKEWKAEIEQIYSNYSIYDTSGGLEQVVFTPDGSQQFRTTTMFNLLKELAVLPKSGRYLDFGCANGTALLASVDHLPGWKRAGYDLSNKYEKQVMAISGVEALYYQAIDRISGKYDLITLLHTLEHISAPSDCLKEIREKLNSSGILVIQVPYFVRNPFDLVVADHANHFSFQSLTATLRASGFEIISIQTDILPKEIIAIAKPSDHSRPFIGQKSKVPRALEQSLEFLSGCIETAHSIIPKGLTGLFGTAIAATWISSEVIDTIRFFVDEDKVRVGRTHLGKPILSVNDLTEKDLIYICMEPVSAANIKRRLADNRAQFVAAEWCGE